MIRKTFLSSLPLSSSAQGVPRMHLCALCMLRDLSEVQIFAHPAHLYPPMPGLHARSDHLSPGHPLAVAAPASRALVETGPHCTLGLDLVFACGRKAWQRLLFFPNTKENHPLLKQQRLQTSIKSSSVYIQVQTITPVTTVSFFKIF